MRSPAYLATVFGTIALLAVVTVVFTILVDPYRMFGTPTVRGWTELKPRAAEQMGIAKTYQLERIAPKTLLLGNSRTEIGLDPTSSQFPAEQRPVFNAAYAGRDVCTSLLMLRDAMAVRIPERIILGVDFQDSLSVARAFVRAGFERSPRKSDAERRLLVDEAGHRNPQREWQVWKDRLAATLTIDALFDSIRTLLDQNPAQKRDNDRARLQPDARLSGIRRSRRLLQPVFGKEDRLPQTIRCLREARFCASLADNSPAGPVSFRACDIGHGESHSVDALHPSVPRGLSRYARRSRVFGRVSRTGNAISSGKSPNSSAGRRR